VNPPLFIQLDILIYSDQSKLDLDKEIISKLDANIINFDLPHNINNYIDRLNRHDQKRENATLLMLDGYNFNELKSLEKALGQKLDQITIPGLEPLKPFVNLSRGKPKHSNKNGKGKPKQKKNGVSATGRRNKNTRNKNTQANQNGKNNKRNVKANGRSKNNNQNQQEGDGQKRQHKGAFGRLNGGTHRKKNNTRVKKVGVSRVGTDAPKGREGKSLAAEVKEKAADNKSKVTIRYNKKRTLSIKKPEEL